MTRVLLLAGLGLGALAGARWVGRRLVDLDPRSLGQLHP